MPPSSPSPVTRRRARIAAGLAVLGALVAVAYGFTDVVEVAVDGETHDLRLYGGTVGEVIDRLGVEVGPADVVSPASDTAVTDGLSVRIDRAITVDVEIDGGIARRITAPVTSVAGVLEAAGMEDVRGLGAEITPGWTAPIADGDTIRVTLPVVVTITVDGRHHEVVTLASHVEAVLVQTGIEVGDDDLVYPGADSPLFGASPVVVVQRVETDEEVEEIALGHDEVRRRTSDLRRGTTRVQHEGRDGLRLDTYAVTRVDGEVVERDLVDQEVVREAQDRIVLVGTYEPPPPPPPPPPTTTTSTSSTSDDSVWDRLARCESGGNWSANTGNGYYGGLQFHPQTWRSVGGSGLPHEHSRATQIEMGKKLQARSGWGQWPACSLKLGLR